MQSRPPSAPEHERAPYQRDPYRRPPPQPRRGIVRPETPTGCAYYLLLLTWCIAAFVRHTSPDGQTGATWHTASGIMFAVSVGLIVTGLWTLLSPPRDRLQGIWITVIGSLAVIGATWGGW